ncbi:hypothetical protein EV421DRAFT_1252261 [Armillaria borealis]|uniref:Secreted protein n=1 Tax=Armillaria borealis TaxID=47425 RepID=A0AA39MIQ4_9AGAR|nr:hypothetical protein EV421DRAFT_1252261 [Armillaria borealis]
MTWWCVGKKRAHFSFLFLLLHLQSNTSSCRNSSTGDPFAMLWNRWMVMHCQQSYMSALQGMKSPNDGKTIASHLWSSCHGTGTEKTCGFHVNAQDFLLSFICTEAPTG